MKYRAIAISSFVTFAILSVLFIGEEVYHREDIDDVILFIKQRPRFKFSYTNPVRCGECDLEELYSLDEKEINAFKEFCSVRYGLDDINSCYAIYAVNQTDALGFIENAIKRIKPPEYKPLNNIPASRVDFDEENNSK